MKTISAVLFSFLALSFQAQPIPETIDYFKPSLVRRNDYGSASAAPGYGNSGSTDHGSTGGKKSHGKGDHAKGVVKTKERLKAKIHSKHHDKGKKASSSDY